MVANIHGYKDHATLIKAWREVVTQSDKTIAIPVLLLAGHPYSGMDDLMKLTNELGLTGTVRFLGPVKDIAGLLGAVDIGVFCSQFEGCPNGVLECMASGLAVAATDIPGIRQAVGPGGYPYLAPPGDPQALASRIITLINNPELRLAVGTANLRRIETEFSADQMCEKMTNLIGEGLNRDR
jgi:glycosyltransferase involved in cell wall biosynthesis